MYLVSYFIGLLDHVTCETVTVNPFPNDKFADDNFKFDENGRKFSKQVENTVGKGETAHHAQFLLFPNCFQKTSTADT